MKNIIIFDYDGVIVDSLDFAFRIHNFLCKKYYFHKTINKKAFKELFNNNFYESLRQEGVSEEQLNQIILNFKNEFIKHAKSMNLFGGVREMINTLSEKYKLIIITSNASQAVKEFLLLNKIDKIRDIIGAEKEKSKVKKILLIKSKNPRSKIYYVGDTTGDIVEGKKADVLTIATTWGYHSKKKLENSNPDYIVDSPQELVELFEILN